MKNDGLYEGLNGYYRLYAGREADFILQDYRESVMRLYYDKKKIKNPVHFRTGKPLAESTLKDYLYTYRRRKQNLSERKAAIRMMAKQGYFGNRPVEKPTNVPHLRLIIGGKK